METSGKSDGKGGKNGAGSRKKRVTKTVKAGLTFPVGRIARYLKKGRYAKRVGGGAAVYLAAVLEYLTAEVLEFAGKAARRFKKTRIIPRHIMLAVRFDEDLDKLFENVTIASGGVIQRINYALFSKKYIEKVKNGKVKNVYAPN